MPAKFQLISEFDLNPLICAGSNITAVDALIVRRALPEPSIRHL